MIKFLEDVLCNVTTSAINDEACDWGSKLLHVKDNWFKSRGEGMRVAIIDSGCCDHDDFDDMVVEKYNTTNNKNDPDGTHGTHISGVVHLVAPDTELISIKALLSSGTGRFEWIESAIDIAINENCDIINMSLGSTEEPEQNFYCAVKKAHRNGIIMLAAAGNEGKKKLNYPAQYEEIISVGAVDKNLNVPVWCNKSDKIDVYGPSETSSPISDNEYKIMTGSSQATGFISGVTALLLAYHRDGGEHLSPCETKTQVINHLHAMSLNILPDLNEMSINGGGE